VERTIRDLLLEQGAGEQAENFLDDLKSKGRYLKDVY